MIDVLHICLGMLILQNNLYLQFFVAELTEVEKLTPGWVNDFQALKGIISHQINYILYVCLVIWSFADKMFVVISNNLEMGSCEVVG